MTKQELVARLAWVASKPFCLLRMIRIRRLEKRIEALSFCEMISEEMSLRKK